ncbi:MAG: glycosyltransferase family 1 protein [Candidatus Methanomethylicota archaeon]|jgi:glycosyltransferase involved in cell wall biosynthesis|uniref:Glycosyltransferase family 1 protein n=1 Tax=Thermoproteota archaeon TaxID=2056631 RepID=A0A523BBA2_9CREN|nr:MAG: glycosyltransferase family 1 protein [Candidatus Verstraetearchaeota archaeon]TDA38144.1 MAG: glycosyltransferase family 1 protein [Candidatus Verstraetearchaeota archaeon]
MKVLILSWEYPPHIIGGLGKHVYHISKALASKNIDTTVITYTDGTSKSEEITDNVRVLRVNPYSLRYPDFTSWIHGMNLLMIEKALKFKNFDIIHVHDWLTALAGINIKHIMRKPLIATIHSTELGRRRGYLSNDHEKHIHEVEWILTYEAWRIICCSNYMVNEVSNFFQCPLNKIVRIYNGIDPNSLLPSNNVNRRKYAEDYEKIVLFVGRLVYEKGPHILIEAANILRRNDIKFLFVGEGSMKPYLLELGKKLGLSEKLYFLGHIPDDILYAIYKMASVAVFPSLYEPFGIVALEAMALGTPVIASAVGGLNEIIINGYNGIKVTPGLAYELAEAIVKIIDDPSLSKKLIENAKNFVKNFTWEKAAEETIKLYEEVIREYNIGNWKPRV